MRRIDTSHAALAIAGAALFVALGGPAWAEGVLVGTHQLKNNAVTARKIAKGAVHNADLAKGSVRGVNIKKATITGGRLAAKAVTTGRLGDGSVTNGKLGDGSVTNGKLGNAAVTTTKLADASVTTGKLADQAVTTGKLADNAVTSAKVADASLTATDVAPNTFLAANGTAVNALALGGFQAGEFVRGGSTRIVVPPTATGVRLLTFPLGFITGSCVAQKPTVAYENASSPVDLNQAAIDSAGGHFQTSGALPGNSAPVPMPNTGNGPQMVITQAAATANPSRVVTATTSGQFQGNQVGCVFTASQTYTG